MSCTSIIIGWETLYSSQLQKLFNAESESMLFDLLVVAGLNVQHFEKNIVIGWKLSSSNTHFMSMKKSVYAVTDECRMRYSMITELESESLFQLISDTMGEAKIIELTM